MTCRCGLIHPDDRVSWYSDGQAWIHANGARLYFWNGSWLCQRFGSCFEIDSHDPWKPPFDTAEGLWERPV